MTGGQIKKNSFIRTKGFSLRWTVYPSSSRTAFLCLSMAPGTPGKLEKRVKAEHTEMSDAAIPVCAVRECGTRSTPGAHTKGPGFITIQRMGHGTADNKPRGNRT